MKVTRILMAASLAFVLLAAIALADRFSSDDTGRAAAGATPTVASTQTQTEADKTADLGETVSEDDEDIENESGAEPEIRALIKAWGVTTDKDAACGMLSNAKKNADTDDYSEYCNVEYPIEEPVIYDSVEISEQDDFTARVEITGHEVTSYSLVKEDGEWKIDDWGTHLDMASPDSDESIEPECYPAPC